MLIELRETLAAQAGRPVRVEVLAHRLGLEPGVVAAMVGHLGARGLLPVALAAPGQAAGHAGDAAACGSATCADALPERCRGCPLAVDGMHPGRAQPTALSRPASWVRRRA